MTVPVVMTVMHHCRDRVFHVLLLCEVLCTFFLVLHECCQAPVVTPILLGRRVNLREERDRAFPGASQLRSKGGVASVCCFQSGVRSCRFPKPSQRSRSHGNSSLANKESHPWGPREGGQLVPQTP